MTARHRCGFATSHSLRSFRTVPPLARLVSHFLLLIRLVDSRPQWRGPHERKGWYAMATTQQTEAIVIGGGLAGFAAASYLARAGKRVTLLEKSRTIGGRARTQTDGGYAFNFGPHALYAGPGQTVLRELGVQYTGGKPVLRGYAVRGGTLHQLPADTRSLLTSNLLSPAEKLEMARFLAGIGRLDPVPLQYVTVRNWLDRTLTHERVRELVAAVIRTATYADEPDRQSAGAAIDQLRLALGGVRYLDGGWRTLVDGLAQSAENAGTTIIAGARVATVERDGARWRVHQEDGGVHTASSVILAVSPPDVQKLLGGDAPIPQTIPVRAACLDVALESLPQAESPYALGLDTPLFLTPQSVAARLAPAGGAVIQIAKYLRHGVPTDAKADERELEALLDLVQPGWQERVAARRFLASMTVSHALVTATEGGTQGRPGPEMPDLPGIYLAGDWVGPEGMLANASLGSAKQAALLALGATPQVDAPVVALAS